MPREIVNIPRSEETRSNPKLDLMALASIVLLFLFSFSLLTIFRQDEVLKEQDECLSRADLLIKRADSLIFEAYKEAGFWHEMYHKEKARN